jgi:hypothetical protein
VLGQVEISRCAEAGYERLFAAAIENVLVYQPVYDEHQSDLTTRWGKMISTTNYTVDAQVFLVLTGVSEE